MNNTTLQPKAIIFDFGGTIDTNGVHWSEKYWDGYCSSNIPISKPIYEKAYVAAGDKMLQGIVDASFSFKQTITTQIGLQLIHLINNGSIKKENYSNYLNSIVDYCYTDVSQTIETAVPLLQKIHNKFNTALVSNFYGNIDRVLDEFQISKYFDVIIDSTVVGVRKPDPAIFQIGVNKMGINANEVLVVGDSYDRDIEPAVRIGCMAAWLKGRSWATQPEGELATIILNNLQELNSILDL